MSWYLLEHKESCIRIDTNLRMQTTESVVSPLIDTDEYKEGCIWIDTYLKELLE